MKTGIKLITSTILYGILIMALAGCSKTPEPPVAKVVPKADTLFGDIRIDNYYWLRDRGTPEVLDYLKAENTYTEAMMKHTEKLQEQLYDEMKARIKETDMDVPVKIDGYYYYSRTEEGKQYKIYCRKKGSLEAAEEVILDPNELAGEHKFYEIGGYSVSDDQNLLAYTVDTTGSETYSAYFKDLRSGKYLPDTLHNTDTEIVWANDNRTVFYPTLGDVHSPDTLWRHHLGENPADDKVVYHEPDEAFYLYVFKAKSKNFIILGLEAKTTTEMRYLDANTPDGEFKVIEPRTEGLEYYVGEHDGQFIIRTNDNALNYKMVSVSTKNPGRRNWKDLIAYRDSVEIENFEVFKDFLVLFERLNGLENIRIKRFAGPEDFYIDFDEPTYSIWDMSNPDYNSKLIRYTYTSFITPRSVYDYNMVDKSRELKKQYEVLGGYDPKFYQSERTWAKADDGVLVPISMVYRTDMQRDGSNPLLLMGYGAYGISMDPYFSSSRLSLIDRGFIYAIAHIRGGGEMGRQWYYDGKLLNKKNTFTDFLTCADFLITEGYTSSDLLVAEGGSAGGMTMGAAANMRPDLFVAIVADVPFVDVLNTMLDPTIPLTVMEYDEWGNPHEEKYYWYIKSYSPYTNVTAQNYPTMLVTAGLNDPRVQYWEPAKWTARLRANKTDNNTLLLKTNMGQGHLGASGRYDYLKDIAFQYAFILDLFGIKE